VLKRRIKNERKGSKSWDPVTNCRLGRELCLSAHPTPALLFSCNSQVVETLNKASEEEEEEEDIINKRDGRRGRRSNIKTEKSSSEGGGCSSLCVWLLLQE
jgi:hypothetical protein